MVERFKYTGVIVDLIYDVVRWQLSARESWATAPWFMPEEEGVFRGDEGIDTLVILNEYRRTTVIPTYWIYDGMWMGTSHVNPLEFEIKIDNGVVHIDMDYFSLVIESIEEQLIIYGVDKDSRESRVFSRLNGFATALNKLYLYGIQLIKLREESELSGLDSGRVEASSC